VGRCHRRTVIDHGHDWIWFSPYGRTMATVGEADHTLRLLDVATGRTIAALGIIKSDVAFSADGTVVAAVDQQGAPHLWSATTGQPVAVLDHHVAGDTAMMFSPDGRNFATISTDEDSIRLSDVASGRTTTILSPVVASSTMELSPAWNALAIIDQEDNLYLWDMDPGHAATYVGQASTYRSLLSFSPDGRTLAWIGADDTLCLWDAARGEHLPVPDNVNDRVDLSPDQRTIAVVDEHDRLRLWNVDSGRFTATLDYLEDARSGRAFSPDGRTFATVGWNGRLRLWDVPTQQPR
jgi:WD40 repeat protein